jgi:HEAT repeat protein
MVEVLSDPSPQVRATAVDALAQVGKSIIPVVHPKLDAPDPQVRKMTAVILSRVNPREFGPIIVGSHITGNLLAIYRNHGLVGTLTPHATYSGIAVLQSALRERNQRLLNEIFYLLTAIHDPAAVRIIDDSLRSENPRVRANATEALESLTSPQTANLVASLFDPEISSDHLLTLSQDTWDMIHPDTPKALQQVVADPNDPWLRAITTYALGEMGATLRKREQKEEEREIEKEKEKREQEDKDVPSPERPGRRARRSPPAVLFGAITDDKPTEDRPTSPEAQERPAERRRRRSPPADLLGEIADDKPAGDADTAPDQLPFTRPEIEAMLEIALADPADEVRLAAQAAKRMMAGLRTTDVIGKEEIVLSTIERIIFLKEVPFFQQMTIDQLRVLATVCEEELFEGNTRIFDEGDPGGVLYVVVSGKVGIEQEKRKGSYARLATLGAHTYFGEMTLFDNSPRSASALALQDTLTLSLSREPLIALARQHPGLSIELIKVLSDRLRQANTRITELTRSRPRELQKFFDKFDE